MYLALKQSTLFILFILATATLLIPPQAMAVPAFARQMNEECSTCHFQHFPKLTAFGRSFKASGFSMSARESLGGENLSIAPDLNASILLRSNYSKSSGSRGVLQIPQEASFLAGGRLADGIGGITEWSGGLLSGKVSFTTNTPMARVGATVFTTDALGASYGFEGMNTGAVRNHFPFERSSKPTLGNNPALELSQAASGLTFYAAPSQATAAQLASMSWFVALTLYTPDSVAAGRTEMDVGGSASQYLRAAWMPKLGKHWEAGIGFGIYNGKTHTTTTGIASGVDAFGNPPGLYDLVSRAWFIDAQIQGMLASRDLGIYIMYASGEKASSAPDEFHIFAGAANAPTSWGIDMEYSLFPQLGLLTSVGAYDNGDATLSAKTSAGLGLYWKIRQNITLQPMYEWYAGDQRDYSNKFTLTLETAF